MQSASSAQALPTHKLSLILFGKWYSFWVVCSQNTLLGQRTGVVNPFFPLLHINFWPSLWKVAAETETRPTSFLTICYRPVFVSFLFYLPMNSLTTLFLLILSCFSVFFCKVGGGSPYNLYDFTFSFKYFSHGRIFGCQSSIQSFGSDPWPLKGI